MKTSEDKLRELSIDELNKWTISRICSRENFQNANKMYGAKNFYVGSWEGERECPHCGESLGCINYKAYHGDKCQFKGVDIEQLTKDWRSDELSIQELPKKYGIKRNTLVYFFYKRGIEKGITYDSNRVCPHCYTECSTSKYHHYHGDACQVKGKLKTIVSKYQSGQSLSSLSREYKLSFVTVRGYIQNYLKNNKL